MSAPPVELDLIRLAQLHQLKAFVILVFRADGTPQVMASNLSEQAQNLAQRHMNELLMALSAPEAGRVLVLPPARSN